MLPVQRRLDIARRLREQGTVLVSELCSLYGVSDETIRRDLKALEREGLVQRQYGGAVTTGPVDPVPPVQERQGVRIQEKRWIARAAARLVADGQVLKLDSGTTTRALARELKLAGRRVGVITYDLMVAQELADAPGIDVYLTGGKLEPQAMYLFGPQAETGLQMYNTDLSFIGAGGVSLERGLTTASIFGAQLKRELMRHCSRAVLLVDASKFGRTGLVTFAPAAGIGTVITDREIPPEYLTGLRELGVEVIIAAAEEEAE